MHRTAYADSWPAAGLKPHLRRGVFTNEPELVVAIDKYTAHHNAAPKPFI